MTQQEILKELVTVRIKKVLLQTAGKTIQYERNLYNQVGRGVTTEEYTSIVDGLVSDGIVKRTSGERAGIILSLVEGA
jgi:hypothetical protein